MYKSVEYKFKKNSIYNKRIIRLFIIYVVVFVCLFIVMTDLKLPLLAIIFSPLIYPALSIIIELTVFDKINIFKKGSITNYIKTSRLFIIIYFLVYSYCLYIIDMEIY